MKQNKIKFYVKICISHFAYLQGSSLLKNINSNVRKFFMATAIRNNPRDSQASG